MLTKEAADTAYEIGVQQALQDAGLVKKADILRRMGKWYGEHGGPWLGLTGEGGLGRAALLTGAGAGIGAGTGAASDTGAGKGALIGGIAGLGGAGGLTAANSLLRQGTLDAFEVHQIAQMFYPDPFRSEVAASLARRVMNHTALGLGAGTAGALGSGYLADKALD
jgi:hypothetical protein